MMTWRAMKFIYFLVALMLCANLSAQNKDDVRLANEYYSMGKYDQAQILYEKLVKNPQNIPLIHNNYLFLLIKKAEFDNAERYVKKLLKRFPANLYYQLDYGLVANRRGNQNESDKWFKQVIDKNKTDSYKTKLAAEYFVNKQLTNYAILAFERSRQVYGDNLLYALEMANIYRLTNKKEKMVGEYLKYVVENPSNLNYVQNTLQNLLTKPDELEILEKLLYEKVQGSPNSETYGELLIWVNLQQKNFYGAFVQAKAIDRRKGTQGSRCNRIGMIAVDNGDYDVAIKIFTYVIDTYPKTVNYILAKMHLIKANEEKVRNTFPVDKEAIRKLVGAYNELVAELGVNRNTLEALRNKASLHAFYLDEKDSAITILNKIINTNRADPNIKSRAKLDLGDIYLLVGQPWESTLLYSQVEKSQKETPIGYQAKLKNAKLSYYKGDFALAEDHLDILKQATTREISNDAIALSLLIKDNVALDSTEEAMQRYAAIDLLLFQNKKQEALAAIEVMRKEFPKHSLTDELLWLEADIQKQFGNFDQAIVLLQKIVDAYDYDVLSDDAYFTLGSILEKQLGQSERAMEVYRDFMTKYPGSVYVAEVRKRFRQLRGDFDEAEKKLVN